MCVMLTVVENHYVTTVLDLFSETHCFPSQQQHCGVLLLPKLAKAFVSVEQILLLLWSLAAHGCVGGWISLLLQ